MNYLEKSCEELDATVFSSDMMFDPERYAMFKRYLGRWNRAVEEHNKAEMTDATPPPPAAPVQPVGNSLMQRTLDLHNRCSMPWSEAAKLSLSEVGIDDARVHELAGNCSDTPMATLLNPDEIQDFTRSLLIYGSDLLHAATAPAAPVPLTDDQIRGLMPKPDGVAESGVRRVEVLPGVMGTEFDEVDAWSMPLVLKIARSIEAAHGITGKGQP
jgi:hypothetical protein